MSINLSEPPPNYAHFRRIEETDALGSPLSRSIFAGYIRGFIDLDGETSERFERENIHGTFEYHTGTAFFDVWQSDIIISVGDFISIKNTVHEIIGIAPPNSHDGIIGLKIRQTERLITYLQLVVNGLPLTVNNIPLEIPQL